MKYEFKPFYLPDYLIDLEEGWLPTYRISEEYPGDIRGVDVFNLGTWAKPQEQVASVDHRDGSVRTHSLDGQFNRAHKVTCLDLILYREAAPKPKEIHGYALVNDAGEVFCVQPYEIHGGSEGYKPIPCTITLHSEPA